MNEYDYELELRKVEALEKIADQLDKLDIRNGHIRVYNKPKTY